MATNTGLTAEQYFDKVAELVAPDYKKISEDIASAWDNNQCLTARQSKWLVNTARFTKGVRSIEMPDELKAEVDYWVDLKFADPHSSRYVKAELPSPEQPDRHEADLITILTAMSASIERISDTLAAKLP